MFKIVFWIFVICNFSWATDQFLDKNVAKALLGPNQFKMYENKMSLLQESKEKKLTIFYLTSASSAKGAKSFDRLIEKLNQKGKEVQGFVVLRGFPKTKKMMDFLMNAYEAGVAGTIKVHPLIFDTFKVTRAPAFALSYCPTGDNFAFRECENKYLAVGDITLTDFFKMVSDKDKKYESYYFELIEAK